MKFKEHLQFLLMMIPTLLLLVAAAVTLAAPAKAAQEKPTASRHAVTVTAIDTAPVQAVVVR